MRKVEAEPAAALDLDVAPVEGVAHVLRERAPVAKSTTALEYLRARRIEHTPAAGWFALPDDLQRLDVLRHEIVDQS